MYIKGKKKRLKTLEASFCSMTLMSTPSSMRTVWRKFSAVLFNDTLLTTVCDCHESVIILTDEFNTFFFKLSKNMVDQSEWRLYNWVNLLLGEGFAAKCNWEPKKLGIGKNHKTNVDEVIHVEIRGYQLALNGYLKAPRIPEYWNMRLNSIDLDSGTHLDPNMRSAAYWTSVSRGDISTAQ